MISKSLSALLSVFLLGSALVSMGCDSSDPSPRQGIYDGPANTLGNGSVNTFVELDASGTPVSMGVRFTEATLTSLPTHGAVETVLALPDDAGVAPYDHVSFDWQPHGHEPNGVYTTPHFDIHFYLMTMAERATIDPADTTKVNRMPAPEHIPVGYVPTPGAVPQMGAHWVDPTSPEFTPAGFSRTFLYGFWDGRMNFVEPMITKAFIESVTTMPGQSVTFPIPQPQAFEKAGFYPTAYSVHYNADAKVYEIVLEGLTKR